MVSVLDVAKYILCKKGELSTWKLQKLCYYAQAWHFTWTEKRLIEERFEAWQNGPVCPRLFDAHRGKYSVSESEISGDISRLSDDEKESINVVIRDYGEMNAYELRELTHSEEPWKQARGNLPESAPCQNEITVESMGEYYGSL